jgi:amino acid adenylation domain-containing protein
VTTTGELLARLRSLDVHVRAEGGRLRINAPKGRLTRDLEAALVARKDELLKVLELDSRRARPELAPVSRSSPPRLSYLQERLWVLDRLQPGSTAYNLASISGVRTGVDVPRLIVAVRRLVARHEILRSRFVLEGETPVVSIGPPDDIVIDVQDLRGWSDERQAEALTRAAGDAALRPFDVRIEPPVRFAVLQTADDAAALLFSAHHIALDSWSVGLLTREIHELYNGLGTGGVEPPAPPLQYVDFAHWQRALMEGDGAAERLAYWRQRLASLPQLSTFPPDHPRSEEGSSWGRTHHLQVAPELYSTMRAAGREMGVTVYMTLLAALAITLSRRTGQNDVAIGSPLGTRQRAELESIIGPIVNPLVLRLDVSDDPSFEQLVARARETVLEGHANQDVAFETLVKELNPERSLGHSPLFQVALVMHNAPDAAETTIVGGGAIYDLTVYATEHNGSLGITFEYRADLYEPATMARIGEHLQSVLSAAVHGRGRRVSQLGALGGRERDLVVEEFNRTCIRLESATLVEQFRRMVSARGDDIAVVGSDRTLTYRALDRLSDRVASRLRASGAGPGSFVALATDRTSSLPAAALGILKSGAAYVPVDLTYPAERIGFMLRDSGAQLIVTTRAMLSAVAVAGTTATVIAIDEPWADDEEATVASEPGEARGPVPTDIAYLIYTSGSTGTPKGVLIPHSAVSNFLGAMRETVGFAPADVILSVTTPSFDISVLELFLPLVAGGRIVVADREAVTDGARLARALESSGTTILQSTPSGWRLLMNAGWEGDRGMSAIVGGEAMPPDLAEWLRPRVRAVWNAYGPTETTVWSTMALLGDGDPITIGTPIANTRIYVLDAHGTYAPIGALGEICIAGAGVARGYHHRPELTSERFVADPVHPGLTMYRTGDIGRWRADGRLDHLGRIDGQVKIRGYRIETGEIEAALVALDAVKEAVVAVRATSPDEPRIVAWVQLHEDEECTGSELRRSLRQRLPEFMIPSMIVPIDSFPLTPNGKIDRQSLPDVFSTSGTVRGGAAPATPTEQAIADIWKGLLGVERISVTDGFFELGGHSLLAMRAASAITARTGRIIDPRLLFFRTLGQLAEACDAEPLAPAIRP